MTGIVDAAGRALLTLTIVADSFPRGISVDVWIDTGFTGELVLPMSVIERLALVKSGSSTPSWRTAHTFNSTPTPV